MLVEAKQNDKITVSFSANVGTKGVKRIKNYIEFLEASSTTEKEMPQKKINAIANDITTDAWQKMRKKKQL